MALIPCPECNREISEKAPQCPSCGCPVAAATKAQNCAPGAQAVSDKGGGSGSTGDKSFQLTKPARGFGPKGKLLVGVLRIVSLAVLLFAVAGIKECMDEAATKRVQEEARRSESFKNLEKQALNGAVKDAAKNIHLDKK